MEIRGTSFLAKGRQSAYSWPDVLFAFSGCCPCYFCLFSDSAAGVPGESYLDARGRVGG